MYVYDEAAKQWQSATPLPQALYYPRCAMLNCQGLVCDGYTINGVLFVHSFQH